MVRNGGQDTKNQGLLQLSKRDQHNPEDEIEFGEDSAAGDEHVPADSVITQVGTPGGSACSQLLRSVALCCFWRQSHLR